MQKITPAFLLLTLLLAALQCTNLSTNDLAGSGVETTNAAISGYAFYPDSRPAYGAWAAIWPDSLDATPHYAAAAKIGGTGETYLVDHNGKFTIPGVKAGSYHIQVRDELSGSTLFEVEVREGDTALLAGADTLRPVGVIVGRIYPPLENNPQNLTRRYVAVLGLNLFTYASTDGFFSIAGVPRGTHAVRFTEYSENAIAKTFDLPSVTVLAGDTTDVDTIRLP